MLTRVRSAASPYVAAVSIVSLLATWRLLAVVHATSSRLVNEDQASLWLAGQELVRTGRLRQPTFPGQAYGVPFEGVGAALLNLLHVPPWWGLPLSLGALSYGGCLAVAWAAWRNRAPAVALLAAGVPLLFAVYPLFLLTSYGTALGRFLAAVGAALAWGGRSLRSAVAAVACAGLAVAFDPSTALLLLPAAILAFPGRRHLLRTHRLPLAAAALPAVAWVGLTSWFSRAHPDFTVNPSPPLLPQWQFAKLVLPHLVHYGDVFAPALLPSGAGALLALDVIAAVVFAVGVACRARWLLVTAAAAAVMLLLALGTERAKEDVSLFLPGSRVLLSLPLLALLLLAAAESAAGDRLRQRALPVAALALLAVSCLVGLVRTDEQEASIRAAAPTAAMVPQVPVTDLQSRCRLLARLVTQTGAATVVLTDDRAMTYGCPVSVPGRYTTLFPPYEKRTWRLYEEERHRPARVLVWGRQCDGSAGLTCTALHDAPPVALVESQGLTTMDVVRALSIPVRPYGVRR